MRIEDEVLTVIQSEPESEWVEYKENFTLEDDKIGDYISALANGALLFQRKHAWIIFGVQDETREIMGIKTNFERKSKTKEELGFYLSKNLKPRLHIIPFSFFKDEKRLCGYKIIPPSGFPVSFKGKRFIRVGSNIQDLAIYPEKEKQIFLNKKVFNFENEIVIDNIDKHDIEKYIDIDGYLKLTGKSTDQNLEGKIKELVKNQIVRENGSYYSLDNLALLLFANDMRNFEFLNSKRIRVIKYSGRNKIETQSDNYGMKGYAIGFKNLMKYIMNFLKKEIIVDGIRKTVYSLPEIAIREILANALVHQDLTLGMLNPTIEIYEDRIEISNVGLPLISDVNRLLDHNPITRNKKMANFLWKLGIVEQRGSGIDKCLFALEELSLPAPRFIKDSFSFKVVLSFKEDLNSMNEDEKIYTTFLHCSLKYISNERMTNSTLRKRFNEDDHSKISKIIKKTLESKLIRIGNPETGTRGRFYLPYYVE